MDVIFLSPPWGGPGYSATERFYFNSMTPDGTEIFRAARSVSASIAYFLPRNVELSQLMALGEPKCEIEQNFINSKNKAVTAYFGDLIMPPT